MHQRLAMPWAIRIQVCGPDYTRPKARSGPAASKTEASCVGGAVTSPEATTAGGMARTQPWLARELNSPGRSSSGRTWMSRQPPAHRRTLGLSDMATVSISLLPRSTLGHSFFPPSLFFLSRARSSAFFRSGGGGGSPVISRQ